MKQLFTLFFLFFSLAGMSQSTIVSAGNDKENVSWTIGEIVTETLIGDFVAIQGFNQPINDSGVGIDEVYTQIKIEAYPNPVRDNLVITVSDAPQYEWRFTDLQGRQLKFGVSHLEETHVDVSTFAHGQYILTIKLRDRVQSIIIMKN